MRTVALVSFLAAASILNGCKDEKAVQQEPKLPPIVLVQKVSFEAQSKQQNYSATIKARVVSDQAFRVSGKVIKRLVNAGDVVKAGMPLAEIDATDLKLQLSQAQAEVGAAEKSLVQQRIETARTEKLTKQGWTAPAALDRQRVSEDEARARLDKAQKNVELVDNSIAYTILAADSDGVITETAIEPGQVIAAGQKAISLAKDGGIEALVAIPETSVSDVANTKASFSIWSHPEKTYDLRLRELSPIADTATRTFAARFTILNPDANIRLGMSGDVKLTTDSAAVAKVPIAAIFDQGKGPGVWHVDRASGKIELHPVTVSNMGPTTAAITTGITDGEYIVALGAQKLDAGLTVRAVDTLQK